MQPRARLPARLALVALGASLGLAVAELALRAVGPFWQRGEIRGLHVARPDRRWLYGLRPGAQGHVRETGEVLYRINPDGWRDRLYERQLPPGVYRILVVGDSISFGYGVAEEEAWPQLLEAWLGRHAPEPRIEVVNLGIGGYNPYTEAALLEDEGLSYQPDLVLLQFSINDLNDPTLHFSSSTRLRLGAIPDAAYPDPSRRRAAERLPPQLVRACHRLHLCAALDELWLAWHTPDFDEAARRAAAVPVAADAGPEWAWLEARYLEMARLAEGAGARFAVLAFPYRAQLDLAPPDPVERRLVDMGARNGWPTLDPLASFRSSYAASPRPLFLDWWHPTVRGHRLAARAVAEGLACQGLLPPSARSLCRGRVRDGGGP